MQNLLTLFSANIFPILIVAGLGFLLAKTQNLDPKPISRITFYLFSPALVFILVANSKLDRDSILLIIGFALTANILAGLTGFILARLFKMDRKVTIAIVLTALLTNAGNYGLSLTQFAFGEEALSYASIYYVTSSLLVYTLGVAIASMGEANLKDSLLNLLKYPTLYALIFAVIFQQTAWQLPVPLERSVTLLGNAAIPAMLLLLGMQLGKVNLGEYKRSIAIATVTRMVIAPLIAIALSVPFKLEGPALQASVTEASTPTAVMTTILATEFDASPALVSAIITVTTLVSPFTLTPLIAYLGGG